MVLIAIVVLISSGLSSGVLLYNDLPDIANFVSCTNRFSCHNALTTNFGYIELILTFITVTTGVYYKIKAYMACHILEKFSSGFIE